MIQNFSDDDKYWHYIVDKAYDSDLTYKQINDLFIGSGSSKRFKGTLLSEIRTIRVWRTETD